MHTAEHVGRVLTFYNIFRRCWVWMLAGKPAILTKIFCIFLSPWGKWQDSTVQSNCSQGMHSWKLRIIQDKFWNTWFLQNFLGFALSQTLHIKWDFINIFYIALFQICTKFDCTVSQFMTRPFLQIHHLSMVLLFNSTKSHYWLHYKITTYSPPPDTHTHTPTHPHSTHTYF
jgi:hypothetical protein